MSAANKGADRLKTAYLKREKRLNEQADFFQGLIDEVSPTAKKPPPTTVMVGLFVIYTQLLEQRIKQFLLAAHGHKSASIRNGDTLLKSHNFDSFPLGKLIDELQEINFSKSPPKKEDYLKPFIAKLNEFKNKRNLYIHKVLNGEISLSKAQFDAELGKASLQLAELIEISEDLISKIYSMLDLDSSFLKLADSMIDQPAAK
jgi:hypothetical protein